MRLEQIAQTDELKGIRVVVTGCGYKPLATTFYDIVSGEPSHDPIFVNDQEMKLNIGGATAGVLARKGAIVHMVSTSQNKLNDIRNNFLNFMSPEKLEYSTADLEDKNSVKEFVNRLPKDKPLYWIQSIGLGAGSYKLKDDNPYLHIQDIPIELLEQESLSVLRATHLMLKEFLLVFKKQKETRVAIISSMSAIRGYSWGGAHCAAKGAISRYTNSAMLDLYQNRIFITDVRPGGVDTGLYDNQIIQESVSDISDEYNGQYRKHFCLAPPTSVGQAIALVLTAPCHFPSINLVAKGQFPNEGS